MLTANKNPKLLKANPWNSNRVGPENMAKLKRSIQDLGFASAVVVRELRDGTLQILGGHHRVEAAIELGIKEVPVLNLGSISDERAKKISLVDNSRYGVDDTISLAKLYEEIGMTSDQLAEFLPYTEVDFETIKRAVDIDLDHLDDLVVDDGEQEPHEPARERPLKTHEVLRFRVALKDAERIRQLIEKTIKCEGLDDGDDLTAAGSALAILLFSGEEV